MDENLSDKLRVEFPEQHVALIQINRPDKKNALHSSMVIELGRILVELEGNNEVRCVVLTGTDQYFSAGADIKEMVRFGPVNVANNPKRMQAWKVIESFTKPLIAAVNGMAFGGGCELAMLCDFIIGGADAKFGQPEILLGGIPGDGGTQRLPRKLGPNVATFMLMTGEPIDAYRAKELGMIVEICEPSAAIGRALEIASKIAQRAPAAVQAVKACVAVAIAATVENGLTFEREAISKLALTEDSREGMLAFSEKRAPVFKGR
ncbi:enoyl-CoA hydratase-related protein [Rhizobium laguerreae]|uniref:enoyl-CoA hydratase-related protein n=1 Tax=Rhizobium laguerreae TaxID=1076926 RepID=UPI001C9038CF|nr:enoyl-CoA hydratase-related protein [Rhizobium laguerreae]MBY3171501.1 2,3-dehydroadipyl-CoA hydratase [Rhizobium laguerreae]